MEKRAWTINELNEAGIVGKTKSYEEINAGRLKARKLGNRTLILSEDLEAWLATLPVVAPKTAA